MKILIILCFFLVHTGLSAQNGARKLSFGSVDGNTKVLDRYVRGNTAVADSASLVKEVNGLITDLQADGFLLASVDSLAYVGDTILAYVYTGQQYRWGALEIKGVPEEWGKSATRQSRRLINGSHYADAFKHVLRYANNNGYPFAKIGLDSLSIDGDELYGTAMLNPGPLIRFDSLDVTGSASHKRYLSHYLKLKVGSLYSEKKVERIPELIEAWPYYQLTGPVELLFHNNDARIHLDVERVKANRFDGIIGFLPNSSRGGGTLITGELNLELLNPFETGKEVRFHWRRFREESQNLDIRLKFPHFFRTPLDFFAGFQQLKEDTTFINRDAQLGAGISLSSRSDFRFFANFKSADLLSAEQVEAPQGALEVADFRLQRYGWGYSYRSFDGSEVMSQGLELTAEFSLGNREVQRNPNLEDSLYEGIPTNSVLYQIDLAMSYQKSVSRLVSFYHRIGSGNLFNASLFKNDMYRLGGLNSLRGFNENEFFASNYILSNAELRLFFEQSSFLFLFYDQSYFTTNLGDERDHLAPLGVGLGMQLNTRSGNFKFAYALGSSRDQPFDFGLSKIHFGIISRF